MAHNGWDHALKVTGGGTGLVGHAGAVLLRKAADQAGLTAGLIAGKARAPVIEMSERSGSPGCRTLAANPIATETGHTSLNRSATFSSLPIFGVSRSAS